MLCDRVVLCLCFLGLGLGLGLGFGLGLSRLGFGSWSWSPSWSDMIKRPSCPSFLRAKDYDKTACQVRRERQREVKGVIGLDKRNVQDKTLYLSCFILSCLVLSLHVLSRFALFLSCLAMAETRRPDTFCLVMSCLVESFRLTYPVVSCLVFVLSCVCLVFVLSCVCLVLSCLVLVLSCLVSLGGERPEGRKTEERNRAIDTNRGQADQGVFINGEIV